MKLLRRQGARLNFCVLNQHGGTEGAVFHRGKLKRAVALQMRGDF
jgi:hypothetical protein